MGACTLIHNISNPSQKNTVIVKARCSCGEKEKLFEGDLKEAKKDWAWMNQTLMNIGADWLSVHDCE